MNSPQAMTATERRNRQEDLGLFVTATRRQEPPQPEKRNRMSEAATQQNLPKNRQPPARSMAQQTLEHMLTEPSFKSVAMHELKRAAVYVPVIVALTAGMVWAQKRFILSAVVPTAIP